MEIGGDKKIPVVRVLKLSLDQLLGPVSEKGIVEYGKQEDINRQSEIAGKRLMEIFDGEAEVNE